MSRAVNKRTHISLIHMFNPLSPLSPPETIPPIPAHCNMYRKERRACVTHTSKLWSDMDLQKWTVDTLWVRTTVSANMYITLLTHIDALHSDELCTQSIFPFRLSFRGEVGPGDMGDPNHSLPLHKMAWHQSDCRNTLLIRSICLQQQMDTMSRSTESLNSLVIGADKSI